MDGASGAGTPELELRLLGPIEAERDGVPATLGGPKPRALLAALALEPGRVVSVDRLVEALWPGDPPETAAHAVQVYVSQLRKALGPVIATRAAGYELELAPERVDLHRFSRLTQEGRAALEGGDPAAAEGALREALALWRGPALSDFLYEPFAQTEIARLEELRTVTLEERIEADLALGRHAELVAELEALVAAQPLRERPRAQLMLALYRSGRQADALAAYRTARETLVEELGIDPGPELRELEAAILRQDESLLLEEAPLARPAMQFRRLVTILFVDVVESMALAEALDPEALGRVLQSYFETVSAAIVRHGGTVEKFAGDAVMAAFGIPISHEDDALRAARAALDIRARHRGAQRAPRAAARSRARDPHRDRSRRGRCDADRRAAAARHGRGGGDRCEARGCGRSGRDRRRRARRAADRPRRARSILWASSRSRASASRCRRIDSLELSPVAPAFEQRQDARLVGRKRELAALRRTLKRSVDGSAVRVAVVVGSPGVGKSRLAAELTRRAKGVTTLWGRCLSYGEGITYWPLREALGTGGRERRAGGSSRRARRRDAAARARARLALPPVLRGERARAAARPRLRRRPLGRADVPRARRAPRGQGGWADRCRLPRARGAARRAARRSSKDARTRIGSCSTRSPRGDGRAARRSRRDDPRVGSARAHRRGALRGTRSSSSSSSRSRWKAASPSARCRRRSRRCSQPASTGSARASARCSSAEPSSGRSSGQPTSSRCSIRTRRRRPTRTCRRSPAAASYGRAETARSASGTSSCRRPSIARRRSDSERNCTSATPTGSTRSRRIFPTSTSSSATTSSRRTGLRTELGESDRRTETPGRRRRDDGLAQQAFVRSSAGTCPRRSSLLGRAIVVASARDEARRASCCASSASRSAAGERGRGDRTHSSSAIEARDGARAATRRAARPDRGAYVRLLTEPEGAHGELCSIRRRGRDPTFRGRSGTIDRSVGAWLSDRLRARRTSRRPRGLGGSRGARARPLRRTAFPPATCLGQIAAAIYWGPTPVPAAIERCVELLDDERQRATSAGRTWVPYLGGLYAQVGDFDARARAHRRARSGSTKSSVTGSAARSVRHRAR